jgi:sugar-specific transcriptional regulator TrmB
MKKTLHSDHYELLRQLGLSEKEITLYITALSHSPFSITSISNASSIKRPTCYLVIESLIKKGLIVETASQNKSLYRAESPDILQTISERLQSKLAKTIESLRSIESDRDSEETSIDLYRGVSGVQKAYLRMLHTNDKNIYYLGDVESILQSTTEPFIDNWINERIRKNIWSHGIRMKRTEREKKLYKSLDENKRELSFAPEGFSLRNCVYMYDNTTVIIGSDSQNGFALHITNKHLNETMMSLYTALKSISTNE